MPKIVLKVELKELHDRASEATQFLKSKGVGKMKTKGTQVQIEGARHKEVKLQLHKFLHHQGLDHYRVLSQSGVLEVRALGKHATHPVEGEGGGSPPTTAQTMPYLFPKTPVLVTEKKKRAKPKHKRV